MKKLFTLIALSFFSVAYGQKPMYVSTYGGEVYKVDIENCTSTRISDFGYNYLDLAVTPDRRLWGIAAAKLWLIDTLTGIPTEIGRTNLSSVSLEALDDSTLLMDHMQDLYAVNVNDPSQKRVIGNMGYQPCGDFTWLDDDLYLTACGQLIRIELDANYTSIVSVTALNANLGNNGYIHHSEGMATAELTNDYNAIIAFGANAAEDVCEFNGTAKYVCWSLVPDAISGAGSLRLPTQFPKPTSCVVPANFSLGEDFNAEWSTYPNPAGELLTLEGPRVLQNAVVELYNTQGQRVYQKDELNGKTLELNTEELPNGLYILNISEEGVKLHSQNLEIKH